VNKAFKKNLLQCKQEFPASQSARKPDLIFLAEGIDPASVTPDEGNEQIDQTQEKRKDKEIKRHKPYFSRAE
jgi:hypothetical protein